MTRLEESMQRIGALDNTVDELRRRFDSLDERFNRFVATTEVNNQSKETKMDERFASLESTLTSFITLIQQQNPRSSQPESSGANLMQPDPQNVNQVSPRHFEHYRRESELGYRPVEHRHENRKGLYKKVEMPIFSGVNPFGWIAQAERYFRVMQSTPEYQLELASLSLEEDALCWFNYEIEYGDFKDWFDFKRRLLSRFAESFEKTPGKRLFSIQQTGSIAEYVREFQELASQIKLAEAHKIDIFFNGLKREMKEVIMMKEPQTLSDHIQAVIKMEDSEFCRLFSGGKVHENRQGKQTTSSGFKSLVTPTNQAWTNKAKQQEPVAKTTIPAVNTKTQGRVKLSDAEYEHKKKNGICFSCDEKWTRAHYNNCKNRHLQVMVVAQGCEVELIDEEFHDSCEELQGTTTEVMEFSLHSFMGWSSPTTMKIEGRIGKSKVVVLIDSGATHNFLSPTVMKKSQLQIDETSAFKVLVGTGITVNGAGVCRGVSLQLQSVLIKSDFIVLDPGSADVVLGVQWLRTLGKCEVNWETQVLEFDSAQGSHIGWRQSFTYAGFSFTVDHFGYRFTKC